MIKLDELKSEKEVRVYFLKSGLTDAEINKILDGTGIRNIAVIESKIEFYMRLFNFQRRETLDVIVSYPQLLGMDTVTSEPTSVSSKLTYYVRRFHLSADEVIKAVRSFPSLLNYDVAESEKQTSVSRKLEKISVELNLTEEDLRELFLSYPRILSYSTSGDEVSIDKKIEFYMEKLNLTRKEVQAMIKKAPVLLGFDTITDAPKSANRKIATLKQIATKEQIRDNPFLLSLPANKIKFRYMLLSPYSPNAIENGDLIINEKKAYARIMHLLERGKAPTISRITYPEVLFESRHGKIAKGAYPLTLEAVKAVEENFQRITGANLKLSAEEILAVISEDGPKKYPKVYEERED